MDCFAPHKVSCSLSLALGEGDNLLGPLDLDPENSLGIDVGRVRTLAAVKENLGRAQLDDIEFVAYLLSFTFIKPSSLKYVETSETVAMHITTAKEIGGFFFGELGSAKLAENLEPTFEDDLELDSLECHPYFTLFNYCKDEEILPDHDRSEANLISCILDYNDWPDPTKDLEEGLDLDNLNCHSYLALLNYCKDEEILPDHDHSKANLISCILEYNEEEARAIYK